MENKVLLSICIPTCNRGSILDTVILNYITNEEFDDSVELVISDNASTDNTEEIVKEIIKKYPSKKISYYLKKVLAFFQKHDIINLASRERKSEAKYGGIAQLGERLNGIQEVSGSIPLISTKSSEEARKTLKSLDFKVFSFPKVGKSQYSLFAPVRLIFDGNFENQEVRYYEEN